MTDDERKNRNPAPERGTFNVDDCPELHVSDLEFGHVYLLQGQRLTASFNYAGKAPVIDPATLDTVICHRFEGPRVDLTVNLMAAPDGTLHAGNGQKITIRKYPGDDV